MRTILNAGYVAAAMLALAAVPANAATVRYSYTGADTSTFSGSQTGYNDAGIIVTTPWVPPAPITGWIELDTELAANLTNVNISVSVDSWAFDSGNFMKLNNTCACDYGFLMSVSTNAQGAITEWNFEAGNGGSGGFGIITSRFLHAPISENGESIEQQFYSNVIASSASVGSWSGPTVVPIPAAVWLFGSCLGWLGWLRLRQAA